MLVLRTAVLVTAMSMVVSVIRYAISLMIVVLILLKSVHVSKNTLHLYIVAYS